VGLHRLLAWWQRHAVLLLPGPRQGDRQHPDARCEVLAAGEGQQAPPIDGTVSDEYVVRELFPKLVDNETSPLDLTTDNELPDICAQLLSASANRLAEEKLEKQLKNRLREKMGIHTYAFTTGYVIKCQVTPEKKPRHPDPGEMIGGRKESRKYVVTEDMAA
jgi:hypothetical protein